MSFAKAEIEVIQELSGFKLSLFLAVRHEEFLDGVCRLSPAELSRKYKQLSNESNTARTRKQMIKDGWFIEVDGGIITKTFNTTAKIAVNNNDELQKLQYNEQNTAKIAVNSVDETAKIAVTGTNELQKLQSNTAKIAGTEIALKDLDFKKNLSLSSSGGESRNGKKSRFSLPECLKYVEKIKKEGANIHNPQAYAMTLFKSGDSDPFIEAALKPPKISEKPEDIKNRSNCRKCLGNSSGFEFKFDDNGKSLGIMYGKTCDHEN